MATVQDIATNNNYRGDVGLGGGSQGQFKVDLSAFQRLADFSYLKAKDDAEQERKQKAADVEMVTKDLSIDYSAIPDKWRQEVIDKLKEFQDFYQQNPDSVRVESGKYGDYLKKKTELANLAKAGTARGVEFKAELAKINTLAADSPNKEAMIANLKKKMEESNIYTPLEVTSKVDVTSNIADTPFTSKTFVEGKNSNVEIQAAGYNAFDAWGKIPAYTAGLTAMNTPAYLRTLQAMTDSRNKMIDNLNGPVDFDGLPLAKQIKEYNEYLLKAKTTTIGETGKKQVELWGGEPPMIDPTKPITIEDMAAIYAFHANGKGVSIIEDGTQTNAAIQRENNQLDYKLGIYGINEGARQFDKGFNLKDGAEEPTEGNLFDSLRTIYDSKGTGDFIDVKDLGVQYQDALESNNEDYGNATKIKIVGDKIEYYKTVKSESGVVSDVKIGEIKRDAANAKGNGYLNTLAKERKGQIVYPVYNAKKASEPNSPATATTKFTPISQQVDPTTLKVNEGYTVNGKNYIWDGKKLNLVK